jgi:hypothetical protein
MVLAERVMPRRRCFGGGAALELKNDDGGKLPAVVIYAFSA